MELLLDEGRVYGARYYTVKPVIDWWLSSTDSNNPWLEMKRWCKNAYGPTPIDGVWTPGAQWYMNNGKFWFRNEADLTMFVLRWS